MIPIGSRYEGAYDVGNGRRILDSMYAAFWVVGKMTARGKSTRLGAAAYGIAATRLEEYKY